MNATATITDYAGNTFAASRLSEPESPSFDPIGAARDRAYQAMPEISKNAREGQPEIGGTVRVLEGKHAGRTGKVFWMGRSMFAGRSYGSPMEIAFRDACRIGWTVGFHPDDTTPDAKGRIKGIYVDIKNAQPVTE